MRILVAPDSFKGSLSARQAADAIAAGIRQSIPHAEIVTLPMADGGEGTVDVLLDNLGGSKIPIQVHGPLGEGVEACFGVLADGETGVMEMASASGLTLIPEEKRNPLLTSTYGTGEVLRGMLDHGCRKIIIGIGGSATNDGGAGMAQALGAQFFDREGNLLMVRGGNLDQIASIRMDELDERLHEAEIWVACDVNNPLLGRQGAARIYGPQKGATKEMVEILEKNIAHFNDVLVAASGMDVADRPGAGAAGGLGAGLMVFAGGRFKSGVELIMEMVAFDQLLGDAQCLCTGEGKLDLQTLQGKVVAGLIEKAQRYEIPTFVFAGEIAGDSAWEKMNLMVPFSIAEGPAERQTMMGDAAGLLKRASARVFRTVQIAVGRLKDNGKTENLCDPSDSKRRPLDLDGNR